MATIKGNKKLNWAVRVQTFSLPLPPFPPPTSFIPPPKFILSFGVRAVAAHNEACRDPSGCEGAQFLGSNTDSLGSLLHTHTFTNTPASSHLYTHTHTHTHTHTSVHARTHTHGITRARNTPPSPPQTSPYSCVSVSAGYISHDKTAHTVHITIRRGNARWRQCPSKCR